LRMRCASEFETILAGLCCEVLWNERLLLRYSYCPPV
jgi:hypothetical protein